MCYSQPYEESFFSLEWLITKQTWGWEIDERNLKNMNLTHFHPKSIENLKKKKQLSQHQICCQNIGHQKFLSKHQMWKHQKWQHWLWQRITQPASLLPTAVARMCSAAELPPEVANGSRVKQNFGHIFVCQLFCFSEWRNKVRRWRFWCAN